MGHLGFTHCVWFKNRIGAHENLEAGREFEMSDVESTWYHVIGDRVIVH
jgi:hypothetical protein